MQCTNNLQHVYIYTVGITVLSRVGASNHCPHIGTDSLIANFLNASELRNSEAFFNSKTQIMKSSCSNILGHVLRDIKPKKGSSVVVCKFCGASKQKVDAEAKPVSDA